MIGSILYMDKQAAEAIHFFPQVAEERLSWQKAQHDNEDSFYEALSLEIEKAPELILMGPDEEKSSFRKWISQHKRHLGKKLIAVLSMDSLNEDRARVFRDKYFH